MKIEIIVTIADKKAASQISDAIRILEKAFESANIKTERISADGDGIYITKENA